MREKKETRDVDLLCEKEGKLHFFIFPYLFLIFCEKKIMYPPNKNSSSSSQHIRRISDGGSSSRYTLPPLSTSSSSRTNNTTVPTSLPPLHFNESYQQPQLQKQKSTYSYSYQPPAAESSFSNGGRNQIEPNRNIQHEEFYYPVYTKYEWSEGN
jgi:hypothetical protein